jgi:hypothetical protein
VNYPGKTWTFHATTEAGTWIWTGQDMVNCKTMQLRFAVKRSSKDSYEFKTEAGLKADAMGVMIDGKGNRATLSPAKAAPK